MNKIIDTEQLKYDVKKGYEKVEDEMKELKDKAVNKTKDGVERAKELSERAKEKMGL
ncbi:hypothetical protein lbkm_1264 [Lachnospiraceae bacterium KM106-2]|nr:hypothetical protein lbkm_1264 [Lachnospiraceae bacterium KM106-2]